MLDSIFDATFLNPTVQIWVSVFLTLAILSFLYRDNPLYKLCENLVLGISLGYGWVMGWTKSVDPYLIKPVKDMFIDFQPYDLTMIFWLGMGVTLLFRFSRKKAWVANYYMAFVFAYMAGMSIPLQVQNLFVMAANMMQPILQKPSFFEISKWIVIIFGCFAGLVYFFFSKPHKGAIGKTARVGILILMINFGASFGATVMGRVALFIGRAQVLASYYVESLVCAGLIIAFLFVYFKFVHKETEFDDSIV